MNRLILMPNDYNKVYISQPLLPGMKRGSSEENLMQYQSERCEKRLLQSPMKPLICCFCNERCTRMDGKILKYARAVLDNKVRYEEEEREKNDVMERMRKIEKSVSEIKGMLATLISQNKQ